MIALLLGVVAAVSSPMPLPQKVGNLVSGAEHAIRVNRLDQAKVMIGRAIAAGASGPGLEQALADLAYASGNNDEALTRYEALLKSSPNDQAYLEPGGIAALRSGDTDLALALLTRATGYQDAGWRAWNALGVVADFKLDWALADRCFQRASQLAPMEPGPLNNKGWSLLSRGKWKEAIPLLERAVAMNPRSLRASNNLELARAALTADLPQRQPGETGAAWAARLNDAGVVAEILGDKQRAVAAFSRSVEASDTWYARAANNLAAVSNR